MPTTVSKSNSNLSSRTRKQIVTTGGGGEGKKIAMEKGLEGALKSREKSAQYQKKKQYSNNNDDDNKTKLLQWIIQQAKVL